MSLFILFNYWVDDIAGVVLIPREYHQPSSLHFCANMNYHW